MLTEVFHWLKAELRRQIEMKSASEDMKYTKERKQSIKSTTTTASQQISSFRRTSFALQGVYSEPAQMLDDITQPSKWSHTKDSKAVSPDLSAQKKIASPSGSRRTSTGTILRESLFHRTESNAIYLTEDVNPHNQTVRINVGGQVFVISKNYLNRYPGTVLGQLSPSTPSYDHVRRQYFFDRNPCVFQSVLDLYRTNELHLPTNVCGKTALNELEFWGIPAIWVSACCWHLLHEVLNDEKLNQDLKRGGWISDTAFAHRGKTRAGSMLLRLHRLYKNTLFRQIWNVVLLLLLVLSLAIFFADSYTEFDFQDYYRIYLSSNVSDPNRPPRVNQGLWITEIVIVAVLLVEFCFTLVLSRSVPQKLDRSLWHVLYGMSLLGSCIGYIVESIMDNPQFWIEKNSLRTAYLFARCVRWLRVLRLYELLDWHSSLYVMWVATMRCHMELLLLLVVFFVQALIFGAITFYAENHPDGEPKSQQQSSQQTTPQTGCVQSETSSPAFANDLTGSLYWAIITMTTVGYGDITPSTTVGRVMGACCALSGVLVLALPVAILTESFQQYSQRQKIREEKRECQEDYLRSATAFRSSVTVGNRASV